MEGWPGLIVPPIAGALIGYMTNWLAIRMLFRPLRAHYLFGIHIPLTPGIIPRRRTELAESIGRMVATDLLGPESVRAHVAHPDFAHILHKFITDTIGRLARMRLYNLVSTAARLIGIARSGSGLRDLLRRIVAAPRSADIVAQLVAEIVRWLGTQPLQRLLSIGKGSTTAIGKLLRDALADRSGAPLGEVLSPKSMAMLRWLAERLYEPACRQLFVLLQRPELERILQHQGVDILDSAISRLTSLQRMFVSLANYRDQLEEEMPHIVARTLASMQQRLATPTTRAHIINRLMDTLHTLIPIQGNSSDIVQASGMAGDMAAGEANDGGGGASAIDIVAQLAVQILTELLSGHNGERLVGEVVDTEALATDIGSRIGTWLRTPATIDDVVVRLETLGLRLLRRHGGRRLVDLLRLSSTRQQWLTERVHGWVLGFLESRAPQLIASADIYGLVTRRINSLDVGGVEKLILGVIARHLKWINLIGAVIGALIGGVQVLIARLG